VVLGNFKNYLIDTASHSRRLVSSATLLWESRTACKNSAGNVINNVALRNFCYYCVAEDRITMKIKPPAEAAERHPWSVAVPCPDLPSAHFSFCYISPSSVLNLLAPEFYI